MDSLKKLLDIEVAKRNKFLDVSYENPDPILIARKEKDERISLICSLFAYGNAKLIVKFLDNLDFSLLKENNEEIIKRELKGKYYRFQKEDDVINIFLTLKRIYEIDSLENIFMQGYKKDNSILAGIYSLIESFEKVNDFESHGYRFLISKKPPQKTAGVGAYKRWNMFLRWMVRKDEIDFGLWKNVKKSDLIIPLDTHTFNVSRKLGLISRKSADLKSALLLTDKLKEFDPLDPVKYDFAIYRLGQSGENFVKKD